MSEAYLWIVPSVFVGTCLTFGTTVAFAVMLRSSDPSQPDTGAAWATGTMLGGAAAFLFTLAVWGLVTQT